MRDGLTRNKRIVRVGITEQTADRQQDLGNGERRRPLILQNVEANTAVAVNVGMIDPRRERNLWRLKRIV